MLENLSALSLEALFKLDRYPGGRSQRQRMAIPGLTPEHLTALHTAGFATASPGPRGSDCRQPFYTITERGQRFIHQLVALARAEGGKA